MIRLPEKFPEPSARHLVAFLAVLALSPAHRLAAECSELHQDRIPNPQGNRIRIVVESAGAPIEQQAIDRAVEMWTRTCSEPLPSFGTSGNIVMRLRFHDGSNDIPGCGDGCACTISNTLAEGTLADGDGEYLASAITHLFERHRDGGGHCRAHRDETVAHEIGHVLGFRHPDDPYAPECRGLIMSFSANRSVRPADCSALASLWRPPFLDGPQLERLRWLPRPAGELIEPAASQTAETEGALRRPASPSQGTVEEPQDP